MCPFAVFPFVIFLIRRYSVFIYFWLDTLLYFVLKDLKRISSFSPYSCFHDYIRFLKKQTNNHSISRSCRVFSIAHLGRNWASLVAQMVKNQPLVQETQVWSLGHEDPLEKGMATHSGILAWRGLAGYSPWGHKEPDTTERLTLLLQKKLLFREMIWGLTYLNICR